MFNTGMSSNSNRSTRKSGGASGAGENYRRVFKPNFGDDSEPSRHSSRLGMVNNSNGYNKPPVIPQVNNRLPRKASKGFGGMRGDTDEEVEYKPIQRSSGMRSNRISDSRERIKQASIGTMGEIGGNIPRASKNTKKPFNSMRSKPKYGEASSGSTLKSSGIKSSISGKGGSSGYEMEFGDDAFEQPQSLTPCPS